MGVMKTMTRTKTRRKRAGKRKRRGGGFAEALFATGNLFAVRDEMRRRGFSWSAGERAWWVPLARVDDALLAWLDLAGAEVRRGLAVW